MAIRSVRCPVLGAHATMVTDLEGNVCRVICPDYEAAGTCRRKKKALEGGPLTRLLERMADDTLDTRDTLCVLRDS